MAEQTPVWICLCPATLYKGNSWDRLPFCFSSSRAQIAEHCYAPAFISLNTCPCLILIIVFSTVCKHEAVMSSVLLNVRVSLWPWVTLGCLSPVAVEMSYCNPSQVQLGSQKLCLYWAMLWLLWHCFCPLCLPTSFEKLLRFCYQSLETSF